MTNHERDLFPGDAQRKRPVSRGRTYGAVNLQQ